MTRLFLLLQFLCYFQQMVCFVHFIWSIKILGLDLSSRHQSGSRWKENDSPGHQVCASHCCGGGGVPRGYSGLSPRRKTGQVPQVLLPWLVCLNEMGADLLGHPFFSHPQALFSSLCFGEKGGSARWIPSGNLPTSWYNIPYGLNPKDVFYHDCTLIITVNAV